MARTWQIHIPLEENVREYWRKRARLLGISPAELVGRILTEVHLRGFTSLDGAPTVGANPVVSRNAATASASFVQICEGPSVSAEVLAQGKPELLSESSRRDFDFKKCPTATVKTVYFQESREELFQELILKYSFPGDFLEEECLLCYGKFISNFRWLTTKEESELEEAKKKRAALVSSWKIQRDEILREISEVNKLVSSSEGRVNRVAKVKYRSLLAELKAFEEKTRWHLREW
jgi:hypothetical protein